MKNTQSKIKPIKTGKEFGTTYCLGCKNYTDHFEPQEVKMTNKMPREKPNCVVCWSSKSRFLKQKYNYKKQLNDTINCQFVLLKTKSSFCRLQNIQIYCKNCQKHTENTFPKKIVPTSKNIIKEKSNVLFV